MYVYLELEVVKQGWHITWNLGLKVKRCFSINILFKYEYVIHSWASLLFVPYPSCLPAFCSPRSLFPNYSSSLCPSLFLWFWLIESYFGFLLFSVSKICIWLFSSGYVKKYSFYFSRVEMLWSCHWPYPCIPALWAGPDTV